VLDRQKSMGVRAQVQGERKNGTSARGPLKKKSKFLKQDLKYSVHAGKIETIPLVYTKIGAGEVLEQGGDTPMETFSWCWPIF